MYEPFTKVLNRVISTDAELGNVNNEYIIISNYRKDDLIGQIDELKRLGYRIGIIVPEYNYNTISPLAENGTDVDNT